MPRRFERPEHPQLDLATIAPRGALTPLPGLMRPLLLPDGGVPRLFADMMEVFASQSSSPCGIAYSPRDIGYYLLTPAHSIYLTRGRGLPPETHETFMGMLHGSMSRLFRPERGIIRRVSLRPHSGATYVEALFESNRHLEDTRRRVVACLGTAMGRYVRAPAFYSPRIALGHFNTHVPPQDARSNILQAVGRYIAPGQEVTLGKICRVVDGAGEDEGSVRARRGPASTFSSFRTR